MARQILDDVRYQEDFEDQAPGTTVVLTTGGWEAATYVDPADDWHPLDDGSYVSADGLIRSWPPAGPGPG